MVQTILVDNEIEKVRNYVPMVDMNTLVAMEHIDKFVWQGETPGHHMHPPISLFATTNAYAFTTLCCHVAQQFP